MFNFFKKKNKNIDRTDSQFQAKESIDEKTQLIQRWDAFLAKIEERFHTSTDQAKEALLEQLVENDYDYNATLRAWKSMRSKILKITDQIKLTWDTKVGPKMEPLGDFHYDEENKGDILSDKLYDHMAIHAINIEGAIAQAFYEHAIKTIEKDFLCTQCHSPLQIDKEVFRSHYVDCQYCNTTNTYQPNVKYNQIGWFAIDALVEMKCLEEFKGLQAAETKINDIRPPVSNEVIKEHQEAYWIYHNKILDTKETYKSDEVERRDIYMNQLEVNRLDYIKRHT